MATHNPFDDILHEIAEVKGLILQERTERQRAGKQGNGDGYMTIKQAADHTKLSKFTLYRLTSQELIPHIKRNNRLLFLKADLDRWLEDARVRVRTEDVSEKTVVS